MLAIFLSLPSSHFYSNFFRSLILESSLQPPSQGDQEILYQTSVLIHTYRSTDTFCSTDWVEKMVASTYVSLSHVDESILTAVALHNTSGRLTPSVRRLLDLGSN